VHELAWAGEELWVVTARFSCLCTLHPDYSFVPRWRPPFVSALAAEDLAVLLPVDLAVDLLRGGLNLPAFQALDDAPLDEGQALPFRQ
jgi:hypothetical protein